MTKPAKYLIGYYANWEFVVVATYSNEAMRLEDSVFVNAASSLAEAIRTVSGNKGICMLLED